MHTYMYLHIHTNSVSPVDTERPSDCSCLGHGMFLWFDANSQGGHKTADDKLYAAMTGDDDMEDQGGQEAPASCTSLGSWSHGTHGEKLLGPPAGAAGAVASWSTTFFKRGRKTTLLPRQ